MVPASFTMPLFREQKGAVMRTFLDLRMFDPASDDISFVTKDTLLLFPNDCMMTLGDIRIVNWQKVVRDEGGFEVTAASRDLKYGRVRLKDQEACKVLHHLLIDLVDDRAGHGQNLLRFDNDGLAVLSRAVAQITYTDSYLAIYFDDPAYACWYTPQDLSPEDLYYDVFDTFTAEGALFVTTPAGLREDTYPAAINVHHWYGIYRSVYVTKQRQPHQPVREYLHSGFFLGANTTANISIYKPDRPALNKLYAEIREWVESTPQMRGLCVPLIDDRWVRVDKIASVGVRPSPRRPSVRLTFINDRMIEVVTKTKDEAEAINRDFIRAVHRHIHTMQPSTPNHG